VTENRGQLVFSTAKSGKERSVPLPKFLLAELEEALAGKEPQALVFQSSNAGVLRNRNFVRRIFAPATRAASVPGLTPHGLRHSAASLAISAGANVKVVQQMLGHETATMTLDRYGHLFPDQLDDVADRLDSIRHDAAERLLSQVPGNLSIVTDEKALTCGDDVSRLWESNPRPTHYECVALAD
jgi:integrase